MSESGVGLRSHPVIGVLHPGAMGAALGSALKPVAGAVIWAAAGRSHATAKRAELADLVAVPDLVELARRCDVIISACPPEAALDVAGQVADALVGRSERPLFVETNLVAPATVRRIADLLGRATVVDGAVVGPPAWEPGHTVLWLAGAAAEDVAGLFAGSPFEPRVLGREPGTASALTACLALQSKALPAIWLEIVAAARGYGVESALRDELARSGIDLAAELDELTGRAGPNARRWAAELDEVAEAITALELPDGFSRAAADIYRGVADGTWG